MSTEDGKTSTPVHANCYQALSPTQRLLVDHMKAGKTLMWCGDAGPELQGHPFWPQKSTVQAMIKKGVLKWGTPNNKSQEQAGMIPVVFA